MSDAAHICFLFCTNITGIFLNWKFIIPHCWHVLYTMHTLNAYSRLAIWQSTVVSLQKNACFMFLWSEAILRCYSITTWGLWQPYYFYLYRATLSHKLNTLILSSKMQPLLNSWDYLTIETITQIRPTEIIDPVVSDFSYCCLALLYFTCPICQLYMKTKRGSI